MSWTSDCSWAEGDLELVVEWPHRGIAETRRQVDGAAIAAAAYRSWPVWEV